MARRSMTYGVLPSLEEFEAACAEPDGDGGESVDDVGFAFGNDERIGTDTLTTGELWNELQNAHRDWEDGDDGAGAWCSAVLGCIGFEWI